jgi:hypothetical protein
MCTWQMWDLHLSVMKPIVAHTLAPDDESLLSCMMFSEDAPLILLGGSTGAVYILRFVSIPTGSTSLPSLLDIVTLSLLTKFLLTVSRFIFATKILVKCAGRVVEGRDRRRRIEEAQRLTSGFCHPAWCSMKLKTLCCIVV